MDKCEVVAVIPARYGSTRFPGKPLVPLLGTPMIVHVIERVREASVADEVVVATDDERIAAVVRTAGARPVLTGEASSGTDRVAMAVRDLPRAAVVLNVQGDEPAVPPASISTLARHLVADPHTPMATLALPATADDLDNPNAVKVVCDLQGRALYFSRAPIPYPRTPVTGLPLRHLGLYGFQRDALLEFAGWPQVEIERAEGLEQLRALAHGMTIQVLAAAGESVAVDAPADVPRAEEALARLKGGS